MAYSGGQKQGGKTRFPWAYIAGGAVVLTAAVAAVVAVWSPHPPQSGAIPLGSVAPSVPLSATTGGTLALSQLRGSKVVVYFYEGVG